jgi:hypothetical protein
LVFLSLRIIGKEGRHMGWIPARKELFLAFFSVLVLVGCATQDRAGGLQGPKIFSSGLAAQSDPEVLGPQSQRAKGEQRVLMVAVRFPDVEPRFSLNAIKKKVTVDLNDYVKDQSYGQTWINPQFMGWVSLPDPLSQYRISPNNFDVDRRRVRKLIEDTMSQVESKVDFKKLDHMLIIPGAFTTPGKGYGMMCYCGNPGMLTGVRGEPRFVTLRSRGGQQFSGGVFVGTENSPLGFFAHDFFHALGGVYQNKRLMP